MQKILKIVSDVMESLGIAYGFERFSGDLKYPYFVGEYTESEVFTEDGARECAFLLTGTTRNTWLELEQCREKIEKAFNPVSGLRPPGQGVAIFYASALPVPTDEANLKRIQINLTCREWRVI